jgi:hypothetical protein
VDVTLVGRDNVQNAVDVPTDPKFNLQFDKNVVNSLIWEANSKCVSLVSQDDENIPVSVTKLDDTIDFIQRQNIYVQPVNPLSPGTAYYLKISPELKAKNGVTLGGTGITIAFKTKGEAAVQPTQSAKPDDIQPAAATETSIQDLDNKPKETTANLATKTISVGVVLVAGWIAFEILINRNKKQ